VRALDKIGEAVRGRRAKTRFALRRRLSRPFVVQEGGEAYRFACGSLDEYMRADSLAWKEPGTIAWINDELRPGDVFFDVGANIGIYTMPAARRVGSDGAVYAFEPHVVNVASLLLNVGLNGVADRVHVLSCALNDATGMFDFRYSDLEVGTSMSQLDADVDAFGRTLEPAAAEMKFATTADALVDQGAVRAPALVKIDVDGNELRVLRGMTGIMTGPDRPRSIQVEVNPAERNQLMTLMSEVGYELTGSHYTVGAEEMLGRGDDPMSVPVNGIFRPQGNR
jgi:FkbM family methyltransferase